MGGMLTKLVDPDYEEREDRLREFEHSLSTLERRVDIAMLKKKKSTNDTMSSDNRPITLYEMFFEVYDDTDPDTDTDDHDDDPI